ncbi:MAG: hypothetical protein WBE63_06835 [Acidobacteriaceae bacterium]
MAESDTFYQKAVRRISWITGVLGVAGTIVATSLRGYRAGLAFLLGAAVSYVSFVGWQRFADALGPDAKRRFGWLFVIRILVLLSVAWVIIKFLGPNVAAGATGLFVGTGAIILEIIYELIYAS